MHERQVKKVWLKHGWPVCRNCIVQHGPFNSKEKAVGRWWQEFTELQPLWCACRRDLIGPSMRVAWRRQGTYNGIMTRSGSSFRSRFTLEHKVDTVKESVVSRFPRAPPKSRVEVRAVEAAELAQLTSPCALWDSKLSNCRTALERDKNSSFVKCYVHWNNQTLQMLGVRRVHKHNVCKTCANARFIEESLYMLD